MGLRITVLQITSSKNFRCFHCKDTKNLIWFAHCLFFRGRSTDASLSTSDGSILRLPTQKFQSFNLGLYSKCGLM
jgi:hypothetical protein